MVSVVCPLLPPDRVWVTLNTAPPNVPATVFGALDFFGFLAARASLAGATPPLEETIFTVPPKASMTVLAGIWVSSVSGTNLPFTSIRTSPLTVEALKLLPRLGAPGGAAFFVLKNTVVPTVLPFLFVATTRTS